MRSTEWHKQWLWLLLFSVAAPVGWSATTVAQSAQTAQPVQAAKAAQSPAQAPADDALLERTPAQYMSFRGADWLERHDRDDLERPDGVIGAMKLKPGQMVADIGCGSGYFSRRIAKVVAPTGKVYCEDIQPEMLEIMTRLATEEKVTGIVPVLGTFDDPKLAKGSIDWMLLVDVYHEFETWKPMLTKMREALAKNGKVALIEYRTEDGTGDHIHPAHRMSVRQVLGEWKSMGYRLVDLQEFLPAQHLFFFESADAPSTSPALTDMSLREAIRLGKVEVQALGAGDGGVTLKVRRKANERLIVTTAAGSYFKASKGEVRDMVATRDGEVPLFDDNWHETKLLASWVDSAKRVAAASDTFELSPARPDLAKLMFIMQSGGLPVSVIQSSLLVTVDNASYDQIEAAVKGGQVPPAHAMALALYYAARAGFNVTATKLWTASDKLIEGVPDKNLRDWLISQKTK